MDLTRNTVITTTLVFVHYIPCLQCTCLRISTDYGYDEDDGYYEDYKEGYDDEYYGDYDEGYGAYYEGYYDDYGYDEYDGMLFGLI